MKLAKTLVTFGALVSLVACGQDNSVSKDKFCEEADKVEKHVYASAHATYYSNLKLSFSGFSEAEIKAMREELKKQGVEEGEQTVEMDFTWGDTGFSTTSESKYAAQVTQLISTTVQATANSFKSASAEDLKGIKFYIKPFKVVETMDLSGQSITMTMQWNEFGYLASMTSKTKIKMTLDAGKTATINSEDRFSFTYQDAAE